MYCSQRLNTFWLPFFHRNFKGNPLSSLSPGCFEGLSSVQYMWVTWCASWCAGNVWGCHWCHQWSDFIPHKPHLQLLLPAGWWYLCSCNIALDYFSFIYSTEITVWCWGCEWMSSVCVCMYSAMHVTTAAYQHTILSWKGALHHSLFIYRNVIYDGSLFKQCVIKIILQKLLWTYKNKPVLSASSLSVS